MFGADTGSAVAAPMVVKLWAQLLVVADMRTGQHVATSAMISLPLSVVSKKLDGWIYSTKSFS